MSSCVNQVYDSPNANFQASVTIPSGGDILGGYDASQNQMIFAYENTCDPFKVMDLTSGWTSPYAVSSSKIGLDNNCQDVSAQVLLYDTPSDYENFTIKQMVIVKYPLTLDYIVVCAGNCVTTDITAYPYGFLFSFYLSTGIPYTGFDGGISTGTAPDGWFIKENGSDVNTNYTEINTIYADYVSNGNMSTIIYGGFKQEDLGGNYYSRPLLEKIEINSSGDASTPTSLQVNDFTDHDDPNKYTSIKAVEINSGASNDTCMIIYQTVLDDPNIETQNVHIRALKFTDDTWYSADYELPSTSAGGEDYNKMLYTSSCVSPPAPQAGSIEYTNGPVIYISVTGTSTVNETKTPIIYALLTNENGTAFQPAQAFSRDGDEDNSGIHVYRNQPGNNSSNWNGLQIDNISYISNSAMSRYLSSVNTNVLFVTLSSIATPQTTRYLSFIAALTGPIQPTSPNPVNRPIIPIINAIAQEESPIWTLNKQGGDLNYLTVKFDSQLTGTLNDLQFKLNFCSNALYLFAFGNYVNSPSQASVSSGLLLNAISNICLSKGTQILCDQGIINIEKINTRKHTINNRTINHITQSIHTDDYLIKIKKNCFSSNSPSSDIICSGDHKILYKNNLIEAKNLINEVYGIEKIKNDKRVLYNILMDKHEVIMANNTPVESLHPQNIIAMFYNNYNNPQAREFLSDKIGQMNKNNLYITEANKTNSIHLRNGTSKKTSIPLRIGNNK
jgi:hypothetical protein